jgi:hypothetical protein
MQRPLTLPALLGAGRIDLGTEFRFVKRIDPEQMTQLGLCPRAPTRKPSAEAARL